MEVDTGSDEECTYLKGTTLNPVIYAAKKIFQFCLFD